MFGFSKKRRQETIDAYSAQDSSKGENSSLRCTLAENIDLISRVFTDVDTVKFKYVDSNYDRSLRYCLIYMDGMVDTSVINDNIIKALLKSSVPAPRKNHMDNLMNRVLEVDEITKTKRPNEVVEAIVSGSTVLLAEGEDQALILNTKSFQTRAITEPENEKIISGPREGFTESLMLNLSLLRKRVRTPDFKMKFYTFGRRTRTQACVCYFNELVNKNILNELYRRLEKIDIDAVLDTNYIAEIIKDSPFTPFLTIGYTEKPDTVIGKLLEGRIALLLDGTPKALTLPYLFIENFQSDEDYYLNFFYASFMRIMRMIGFFLTITVPGLYIAVVAFHQEMVPTQLLINIAAERQSVPLPAVVEAFLMIIVYDILKEAGIRMPNISQALSIVGALVIGQSAVEAKLVAAPMIVVIGLTGISSLLVPKLNAPVIFIRFVILFASASFGLFGFVAALSSALIHLLNLRSFGVPQIMLSGELKFEDVKDSYVRAPWYKMLTRPALSKNRKRVKNNVNEKQA